jgi:hypothetical protein
MPNGSPLAAPFTLDELRERLAELADAEAYLNKAIAAGIDMTKQKAQTADIKTQLLKFAQAFYPGQL